jgi:hypothetical protein
MTQSQLDRAVAHASGEALGTIIRLGFSIVSFGEADFDEDASDLHPSIVDWDALDAEHSHAAA